MSTQRPAAHGDEDHMAMHAQRKLDREARRAARGDDDGPPALGRGPAMGRGHHDHGDEDHMAMHAQRKLDREERRGNDEGLLGRGRRGGPGRRHGPKHDSDSDSEDTEEESNIEIVDLIVADDQVIEFVVEDADMLDIDMDEVIEIALQFVAESGMDVEEDIADVVAEVVKEHKGPKGRRGPGSGERAQRGEFRDAVKTWMDDNSDSRPSFNDFMPEDMEFESMAKGPKGNWWSSPEAKDMDFDMKDLRSQYHDAKKTWGEGRPTWDSWSAEQ